MQQKGGCASERTVENRRFQRIYGADDSDPQKRQGCKLLKEFAFFTGEAIFQYMATRSPGQKLIPVPAKEQFINRLNSGVKRAGYSNRSQFIRDAIVEKLENHGVKLPGNLAEPPARTWQRKSSKPKAPVGKKTRKRK